MKENAMKLSQSNVIPFYPVQKEMKDKVNSTQQILLKEKQNFTNIRQIEDRWKDQIKEALVHDVATMLVKVKKQAISKPLPVSEEERLIQSLINRSRIISQLRVNETTKIYPQEDLIKKNRKKRMHSSFSSKRRRMKSHDLIRYMSQVSKHQPAMDSMLIPPSRNINYPVTKRKWMNMLWNWNFWNQDEGQEDKEVKQKMETRINTLQGELEEIKTLLKEMNNTISTYQQKEETFLTQIEALKNQVHNSTESKTKSAEKPTKEAQPPKESMETEKPKMNAPSRLPRHPKTNNQTRQPFKQQPARDNGVFNPFKYTTKTNHNVRPKMEKHSPHKSMQPEVPKQKKPASPKKPLRHPKPNNMPRQPFKRLPSKDDTVFNPFKYYRDKQ